MDGTPAIEALGLVKRFPLPRRRGAPPEEIAAVDGVTFSVAGGEIFGLVGPDGAGKTTLLRLLTGLLRPTAGEGRVAGSPLDRLGEAGSGIGYMSQRFGLYEDLTVAENLRFFGDLMGVPEEAYLERTARLLAFSGLAPFASRRAGALSGGMKQKLGLSCALLHTPRVLLLDEPTNGVDPVSRRELWRILYDLAREGVTILVSTAYLDEAERCGRLGLLHRGRLLAVDTPAGVRGGRRALEDAFVELVRGQERGDRA